MAARHSAKNSGVSELSVNRISPENGYIKSNAHASSGRCHFTPRVKSASEPAAMLALPSNTAN
jgi:hypothetical protein